VFSWLSTNTAQHSIMITWVPCLKRPTKQKFNIRTWHLENPYQLFVPQVIWSTKEDSKHQLSCAHPPHKFPQLQITSSNWAKFVPWLIVQKTKKLQAKPHVYILYEHPTKNNVQGSCTLSHLEQILMALTDTQRAIWLQMRTMNLSLPWSLKANEDKRYGCCKIGNVLQ
jgi:hypothetical protein